MLNKFNKRSSCDVKYFLRSCISQTMIAVIREMFSSTLFYPKEYYFSGSGEVTSYLIQSLNRLRLRFRLRLRLDFIDPLG